MKQILKVVFLLVIGQTAFGQAPSNYTNINGRYRWIAGMFDSTFHIPKGSTPSLRTGGSTNSGGLFYNTSDSSVYTYTGTQWIKLRGSINPSDTTNKYVTQVYKKSGSDSIFYVKGGVHTWAFNDSTGSPGGGGGGKVYYFNGGVSMGTFGGFTMYELGDTANTGAAANFTRATTGNIANFITDPNKPGLLQIPAGVWSVDAWLSETGGGANHAEIYVQVEKWDGSTITTIATSPIEEITEGGTPNLYTWSVSIPTTTLAVTDRIILQFYIQNTNGKTVTLYTQNGYVGEVHTTFTTGIGAINGLTTPAQYLVTGTSGTDFNINSSTATHTFNLPTASATNRGALSTTDWTTFNNKIGGSLVSGYLTKATAQRTIDTSQIFQSNGKIGIGRTNPTAKVDISDSLGTALRVTNIGPFGVGGDGINVRVNGWSGFAAIIEQRDSVPAGTQYQTVFRKGILPGYGNPAPGGGVAFITQIGGENEIYKNLTVFRSRMIDSAGYSAGQIKGSSQEFWTRKNSIWDTTLVLNQGNVGINTGQNGIDSALTVANGTWLKRGVRMSALPTGVGTKALRIDANGNVSTTDTTATTGFVPYTGATTSLDMGLFNIYGQNIVSNNYATGAAMSSISRSDITASAYGVLQLKRGVWGTLQPNPLTAFDKNWYLPDTSGTLALASQLSGYVPTTRTITINGTSQDLSANRTYNVGTVTSVATNTGTGITGGTITTSGTIAADTLLLSTRAWRQKGVDSVASLINTRISGTTNYIPKFTSSSAIGNSAIYDNGGGEILINTTADVGDFKLQVDGAAWSKGQALAGNYSNLTGFGQVGIYATNASFADGFGTLVISGRQDNTRPILFTTYNGTSVGERMRLDASGNLGIGTSSPANILDIYNTNGFQNRIRITGTTNTSQLQFSNTGGDFYLGIDNSSGSGFGVGGYSRVLYSSNAYPMIFFTNALERMRLDASGRLGIGTTSPTTKLEVNAASDISTSNFTHTGVNGGINIINSGTLANNRDAQLRLVNGTTFFGANDRSYQIVNNGTSATAADLFIQYWNGTSFAERMRITSTGNVGIGTTSPSTALNIESAVNANLGNVSITSNNNDASGLSFKVRNSPSDPTNSRSWMIHSNYSAAGTLEFLSSTTATGNPTTPRFTITKDGNVGIGTTSPTEKLDLQGTMNMNGASGTYLQVQYNAANRGYLGTANATIASGATTDLGISATSNLVFGTGGSLTERMRITSAGNVGIGTSSPSQRLDVNGYARATSGFVGNSGLSLFGDNSSSSVGLFVTTGGNVGIGTTSPGYKLDINGGARLNSGSDGGLLQFNYGVSVSSRSWRIWNDVLANGDFSISQSTTQTGGTYDSKFYINSTGNVGISTTNPTFKLDVRQSSGGDIGAFYYTGGTKNPFIALQANTDNLMVISTGNSDNTAALRFDVSGFERMRITSSGELLINTTSDAGDYKLQVNGNAYLATTSGQALIALKSTGSTVGGQLGIQSTGELFLYMGDNKDMQFSTNGINNMTLKANGNLEIASGSIKTGAPSGGTAKPWKLGQAGVSVGGANTTAVAVEIDGTVYYLLTAYLPEPEPDPAALPSSGPSASYKPYNKPIPVKTTKDVEIENLRKEIEELKQLIKNK